MRMRKALLFLGLLAGPALAWDFRAHRTVVSLACDYMAPATREWVEDCLRLHTDPRARDLEGAATWADLIRKERPETAGWHYINFPLGDGPPPPDRDQVIWALEQSREKVAISGGGPARAEALAFLIHLVGDIHQPLHACSFYGPDFPDGDRGGHSVLLTHAWAKNLHQYWDSAGLEPEVPFQELRSRAAACGGGPSAHQLNPRGWAEESLQLAREVAYPGGRPPGPSLTAEYQERVRAVCAQRLFLAGLRLAYTLEKLGPGADYQKIP